MTTHTNLSTQTMARLIHHMKYAKYLPDQQRREEYKETVSRNLMMHVKKFPRLAQEISEAYKYVFDRKVLPAMRSMQFAGEAIERNNCRLYNCSFTHIDHPDVFQEIMFLLLSGCGVGYSVQQQHVAKLPKIQKPDEPFTYKVPDSIEGWSLAVGKLIDAFLRGKRFPIFDFSGVRPAGSPIVTSGGIAPGPGPLSTALVEIQNILVNKAPGSKLSTLECHDILCHLAHAVLSGGVRRSSYIALFSIDDKEMLECKSGEWWKDNLQRSLANNSAVVLRSELHDRRDQVNAIWDLLENSLSGEPNIFLTNDLDWGCNPCGEIGGPSNFFCNLDEINASNVKNQTDLDQRALIASRLATIQGTYTDFPFLRPIWKERAEQAGLIGVGMTGISRGNILGLNLKRAAKIVLAENKRLAKLLGITKAERSTTIKPSGTSSLALSNGLVVSSGIHPYHSPFWKRRITVTHTEPVYQYLMNEHPWLVEPSAYRPERESVITLPQAAPDGAIMRDEGAMALLERVKYFYDNWISPGHVTGKNTNNISCTVSVKKHEWQMVRDWWWNNTDSFVSLTFMNYDGGVYKQMPMEECSEKEYKRLVKQLRPMDLRSVVEEKDTTTRSQTVACAGGACELV